jgi:hypothetical protein
MLLMLPIWPVKLSTEPPPWNQRRNEMGVYNDDELVLQLRNAGWFQAADRLEQLTEVKEPAEGSVRIRFVASVSLSGAKHVIDVDDETDDVIAIQRSTFSGSTHRCFGTIDVPPVLRTPTVTAVVEEVPQ